MGFIGKIFSLFGGKGSNPTFEEQWETFKELGFTLNEGVKEEDLNRWPEGHEAFEKDPYRLMYVTLGQTLEREPRTPITNKCCNFNAEAIKDQGSYVFIMDNISRLTTGRLNFENIKGYVNQQEKKAWVSFTCRGDNYKWDLKVAGSSLDAELFNKLQNLTDRYKTSRKFTYYDAGDQNFVLGFHSSQELRNIRSLTGLDIVWLKPGQIN